MSSGRASALRIPTTPLQRSARRFRSAGAGRGASPFRSKADSRLDIPDKVGIGLGKGSERTAKRILELLVDGPMRPSALREAVGIKSPIHFSRYYLRPLMEKGMIERTDPDSPKSPRQEYKLA